MHGKKVVSSTVIASTKYLPPIKKRTWDAVKKQWWGQGQALKWEWSLAWL